MEIKMSTSDGKTHTIIRVECVSGTNPNDQDLEKVILKWQISNCLLSFSLRDSSSPLFRFSLRML